MKNKTLPLLLALLLSFSAFLTGCGGTTNNEKSHKLVIYTSMTDTLIGGIVEGFKKEHPNIEVEYQTAGAGKLMKKVDEERRNGKIIADVIWTSEVPDFYQMKEDGLLAEYRPQAFKDILNPFPDYDGFFTAARLGTLGIIINTDKVKTPPVAWEDLASKELYKNAFGIADPSLSGTAFMSIALLKKRFGWGYVERLHKNGAVKCESSSQVIEKTASGELAACLGVDYIATAEIEKGAHLSIVYPKEMIVVPSPIAIFKSTDDMDAAKTFVEYMLSKDAQQKIADVGTIPVRTDVKIPEKYRLPDPQDALKMSIRVDYLDVLHHKNDTIKKFTELFDK